MELQVNRNMADNRLKQIYNVNVDVDPIPRIHKEIGEH